MLGLVTMLVKIPQTILGRLTSLGQEIMLGQVHILVHSNKTLKLLLRVHLKLLLLETLLVH